MPHTIKLALNWSLFYHTRTKFHTKLHTLKWKMAGIHLCLIWFSNTDTIPAWAQTPAVCKAMKCFQSSLLALWAFWMRKKKPSQPHPSAAGLNRVRPRRPSCPPHCALPVLPPNYLPLACPLLLKMSKWAVQSRVRIRDRTQLEERLLQLHPWDGFYAVSLLSLKI